MQSAYKLLFLILFLQAGITRLFGYDSLRLEREGEKAYVIHLVEKGETVYSLSKRYGSGIEEIIAENNIIDNQLALDQELKIPVTIVGEASSPPQMMQTQKVFHFVKTGETLYALSKKYGVTIEDLKSWNQLTTNEISVGQSLIVSGAAVIDPVSLDSGGDDRVKTPLIETRDTKVETTIPTKGSGGSSDERGSGDGFTTYYVQSGDLLETIARKFNARPDSIVIWNNLPNTYLAIGQKLMIKGKADVTRSAGNVTKTAYGTVRKQVDGSGFTKVFEEGIASNIDSSVETEKYLALHRTLPIGTLIEVRNLMNNRKVFVRVVGNLPETGLNKKILVRLTPICFERLGVIDPKTRVEVSYYLD